jgi:hypothetical protein
VYVAGGHPARSSSSGCIPDAQERLLFSESVCCCCMLLFFIPSLMSFTTTTTVPERCFPGVAARALGRRSCAQSCRLRRAYATWKYLICSWNTIVYPVSFRVVEARTRDTGTMMELANGKGQSVFSLLSLFLVIFLL